MEPQSQQPVTNKKMTGRTKLALWLMIGPTALLVVTLIAFAATNFISATSQPSRMDTSYCTDLDNNTSLQNGISAPSNVTCNPSGLFDETSPVNTIVNVILFVAGAAVSITWLPGLIVGIILLNTKPKNTTATSGGPTPPTPPTPPVA